MTVVHAQIMRPDSTGTLKPARGYLRWAPVRGWSTAGNALVLPVPFRVKLAAGSASVTVDPTTVDWAWEVTYELFGLPHEKHLYSVPASGSVLELSALTEVQPLPGTPAAELPANWSVALDASVTAALAVALATVVPAAVSTAVGAALGAEMGAVVDSAVAAAVPSAASTAVNAAVPSAVSSAVSSAVPGAVTAEVTSQLATAVSSAVSAAVPSAVSTAVAAGLTNLPRSVTVVTGSEARPATSATVSWVGGTTQPANMTAGDLWFKAAP